MARKSPSPSPLNAGPKHSGRRISNLITKFAFSSTLSPAKNLLNETINCYLNKYQNSLIKYYKPLTQTQNLKKSKYLSPSTGSHPKSGYPFSISSELDCKPHRDRYMAIFSK